MKLIRIKYGKDSTPKADREYQIDGYGPVGTLKEIKERFPNETFEIKERKKKKKGDWLKYLAGN